MDKKRGIIYSDFLYLFVFFAFIFACSYSTLYFLEYKAQAQETTPKAKEIKHNEISKNEQIYFCTLIRVVDGDTYDLYIRIWDNIFIVKRIRLLDVDTFELKPRKGNEQDRTEEKKKAKQGTEIAEKFLSDGELYFKYSFEVDSFGRSLGTVIRIKDGIEKDVRDILAQANVLKSDSRKK